MSLLGENEPAPKTPLWRKAAIVLGSVAITGGLVFLALFLGSWAFGQREGSLHVGRLERLVEKHPKGDAVRAGLEAEGSRLLGEAAGPGELASLVARTTPDAQAAVLATGQSAARSRAFLAGAYVYWLFFDAEDSLTGFLVVKAPPAS